MKPPEIISQTPAPELCDKCQNVCKLKHLIGILNAALELANDDEPEKVPEIKQGIANAQAEAKKRRCSQV